MRINNKNTAIVILLSFLIACSSIQLASANAILLQNAYRQLQRFSIKDDEQAAKVEALQAVNELSLEQLKEEAELIETDIFNIKNDIELVVNKKLKDYSRFRKDELKNRLNSSQMELSNWQLKKDLSEEASIQLSRERLQLQDKSAREKSSGDSFSAPDQAMNEQKLHNLTLKMRFTELYQNLASQSINLVNSRITLIENILSGKKSGSSSKGLSAKEKNGSVDRSVSLNAEVLKERLSQTRKDLLQLQSLHYELMYQMEQVQNVELLYQMMLRQKYRLTSIPDSLNVGNLLQDLTIRRFQLFEEKAALVTTGARPGELEKVNETLSRVEQMLQIATELNKLEKELQIHQKKLLLLLDQKQLWMATIPPLGPKGLLGMISNLSQQIPVLLKALFSDWVFWLALFIPLFCICYQLAENKWRHKFPAIDYQKDQTLNDWYRIFALILLRPLPLLIAAILINSFGDENRQDITGSWMIGMLVISYSWCVLSATLKHQGVIKIIPVLGENLHPVKPALILSSSIGLWVTAFTMQWYENPFENRLGQLTLACCSIWQLSIFWRWVNDFTRSDWRGLAIKYFSLAILLISAVSAITGYLQLSWLSFSYFQMLTLYGAYLWLFYMAAEYGLKIRTRQMSVSHAMTIKANSEHEATNKEAIKTSREAVQKLENQSRILLTLFFSLVSLMVLTMIWRGLSPLLSPVSETLIFSFSEGPGKLGIALGTLVNVLLILAASWLIARNLPGLLQVLLPAHMARQTANTYIYNRILSYLAWAIGIAMALGQLGIPWDKVQWFVLAIVVGLGLGLQDIVANFFSGIIILLERPIRVGDTVTISERDGTVRKISIRATVIETFDRIELIVPNKVLISNQLTNWSLSSVTIRLSLWYGVSLDSDHALVNKLLLQAADEARLVMATPAPEASFFEYTEHSQRYELRIFLKHADDRFPARNQVNGRMQELFREHDISIAHLQHDLHVTNASLNDDLDRGLPGLSG